MAEKIDEKDLNPGVSPQDVADLENVANETNPLNGLNFIQSLVMAFPVLGQMKHIQMSLFHDQDGYVRLFYDVVDVSKVHVPKSSES